MTNFTSLITSKIGESRGVARLWLEGQKLLKAGVMVGARYEVLACRSTKRLELVPCKEQEARRGFTVSFTYSLSVPSAPGARSGPVALALSDRSFAPKL